MIKIKNEIYYTAKEAAQKLNLSMSRIAQLRNSLHLKFLKICKRKFLYSETNLDDFINGR